MKAGIRKCACLSSQVHALSNYRSETVKHKMMGYANVRALSKVWGAAHEGHEDMIRSSLGGSKQLDWALKYRSIHHTD